MGAVIEVYLGHGGNINIGVASFHKETEMVVGGTGQLSGTHLGKLGTILPTWEEGTRKGHSG